MSLEERLNESYPDAWRPEKPGEIIVGKIVNVTTRVGYNDVPYPIVTLQLKDGSRKAVHAFHAVLKSELANARPRIGQELGIKFLGKPEGKNYVSYRVEVEQTANQEVNWNAIGEDAQLDLQVAGASDVPSDFPASEDDSVPF